MLDELRDRISVFTSQHQFCVISTSGGSGAWAAPAWLYSRGLELVCLLPRWSDVLYHLEQDSHVIVIIQDSQSEALRWLQYLGQAQVVQPGELAQVLPTRRLDMWTNERYVAVRITAEQINLIDENHGWGARETLDL